MKSTHEELVAHDAQNVDLVRYKLHSARKRTNLNGLLQLLLLCMFPVFLSGCFSARMDAYACSKDFGPDIKTRYRYRLEKVSKKDIFSAGEYLEDCHADFWRKVDLCKSLQEYQPNVFSNKGIPVAVSEISRTTDRPFINDWTFNFSARFSLFIIPVRDSLSTKVMYAVKVAKRNDIAKTVDIGWSGKWGVSTIIPSKWILDDTPGERPVGAGYCVSETVENQSMVGHGMLTQAPYWNVDKALAYAVAAKLKEMEESGEMDAILSEGGVRIQSDAGSKDGDVLEVEPRPE